MVFDGRYKLMHAEGGFRPMLFDLKTDPEEFIDLAKGQDHQAEIDRLYGFLHQWSLRPSQRVTKSEDDIKAMRGRSLRRGIIPFLADGSEVEPELLEKYQGKIKEVYIRMRAHPALVGQAEQTKKDIIELAPGIFTAVGYAASNVHMIEGKSSVTIIDTTETTKAAENILAAFRELTDKPIARIIYTHSHRDHISGAQIFCEGQDIPILASHLFKSDLVDVDPDLISANKALMRRTFMQFGIGLTNDERISLGVGPGNRPMEGMGAGFIRPNEIIHHDCDIDLDGIQAQLIHAPGETDDHLIVWLPEQKILFSGDNWYHAFPNLYAIRGTAYRDFQAWADSLSLMADLHPQILAPGTQELSLV